MNKKKLFSLIIAITTLALLMMSIVGCTPKDKVDGVANISNVSYNIDVEIIPGDNTAVIEMKIDCKYNGGATDAIDLVMNANVFTDSTPVPPNEILASYPTGVDYGKVNIKEVTINDEAAAHKLKSNALTISPKKGKINNGKTTFVIKYELKLPHTSLRYGYNKKTLSYQLANFYPQIARLDSYEPLGDPFYSNVADYNVNVICPLEYKVLASGDMIGSVELGERNKYSYKAEKIRDFAIVASKAATIKSKSTDSGYTVNYMHYDKDNESPDRQLNGAANALDVYTELFGSYHRKTLNVVDVDFAQGGMEFGGLIYVDQKANQYSKELIVIHEVAHQWWYGNVGSDQFNHAWQDEGLTEYSVELYLSHGCDKHNPQPTRARAYKDAACNDIKRYIDSAELAGVAYEDCIDRRLDDFTTSADYVHNVYNKGYRMFADVHSLMGNNQFMSALREYYNKFTYKIALPEDMFAVFNNYHSGISVIFNSWLSGSVVNPWSSGSVIPPKQQ